MSGGPTASLVEMTSDELAPWLPQVLERLVAGRVEAGGSPDQASSGSDAQLKAGFPDGSPAPGHHAVHVVADGSRIGAAWISPGPAPDSTERYVLFLELDDAHRLEAFVGATITALETWAVGDGATKLALVVSGQNEELCATYASLGYLVAATSMYKPID